MSTQGIVSVVVGGKMVVKAVGCCSGYNAELLEAEIRRDHLVTPEAVLAAAKRVHFGCPSGLVVQGTDKNLFEGEDLEQAYSDQSKFRIPEHNPQEKHGTAEYVRVVRFPK